MTKKVFSYVSTGIILSTSVLSTEVGIGQFSSIFLCSYVEFSFY